MRKPRSDAKLMSGLSEEQKDQLADWLLTGVSYVKAAQLCAAEFGVETSKGALGEFYHSYCGLRSLERRRDAVNYAAQIAEDARKSPSSFNEAAIELLQQRAFEMLSSPKTDAKDIKALFTMVLKDQALKLDVEKLQQTVRVYEESQAKVKEKVNELRNRGDALSGEERAAILESVDELLGLKR